MGRALRPPSADKRPTGLRSAFFVPGGNPRGRAHTILVRMNNNLNYLLSVLCFILWIVALVDCIKGNSPNKVVWIIVIILVPFIGSILYFALGKSRA